MWGLCCLLLNHLHRSSIVAACSFAPSPDRQPLRCGRSGQEVWQRLGAWGEGGMAAVLSEPSDGSDLCCSYSWLKPSSPFSIRALMKPWLSHIICLYWTFWLSSFHVDPRSFCLVRFGTLLLSVRIFWNDPLRCLFKLCVVWHLLNFPFLSFHSVHWLKNNKIKQA